MTTSFPLTVHRSPLAMRYSFNTIYDQWLLVNARCMVNSQWLMVNGTGGAS